MRTHEEQFFFVQNFHVDKIQHPVYDATHSIPRQVLLDSRTPESFNKYNISELLLHSWNNLQQSQASNQLDTDQIMCVF